MRKVLLLISFILIITNIDKVYSAKPQIDTCLVGTWTGSEKDQQWKNVQKNWIQYRYPDGKLVTKFKTTYPGGMVDESVEYGKWWTKAGKFYEKRKDARKPDIYTYEVVDYNHIIFREFKLPKKFSVANYQFVDTRVEDDKITQLKTK